MNQENYQVLLQVVQEISKRPCEKYMRPRFDLCFKVGDTAINKDDLCIPCKAKFALYNLAKAKRTNK